MARKSFKLYKRPFTCPSLPRARKSRAGRKAADAARRAAKGLDAEKITSAFDRLTQRTIVGYDGIEHKLVSPKRAASLLADAILYEEKRQNKLARQSKKESAAKAGGRKRWAIFPLSQSGHPGETPVQVLGTKKAAQNRAAEIGQWGGRGLVVLPYTK